MQHACTQDQVFMPSVMRYQIKIGITDAPLPEIDKSSAMPAVLSD